MSYTIHSTLGIAGQTLSSIWAGMPAKILILIIALAFCFAGFRLKRWASALYGVLTGVMIGICGTSLISFDTAQFVSLLLTVIAMLIGGIILGAVAMKYQKFGIFLAFAGIGACVGYVPAAFVRETSQLAFLLVLLVSALIFGITGVLFEKPAYLIATSFCGIPAGFALIGLINARAGLPAVIFGAILSVLGLFIQSLLSRSGEKKSKKPEASLDDTDPYLQIPTEPEEKDDIDRISDRVAEYIEITSSFPTYQKSGEQETVDNSTMDVKAIRDEDMTQDAVQSEPETPTEQTDEPKIVIAQNDVVLSEPETAHDEDVMNTDADYITLRPSAIRLAYADSSVSIPEDETTQEVTADEIAVEITSVQASVHMEETEVPATVIRAEELEEPVRVNETSDEGTNVNIVLRDEPDDESEDEPEARKSRKAKKRGGIKPLTILLIVAAIALAAIGIQYVEIMLALCFAGYLLKYYRAAAFACAILCVRRAADIILLVMAQSTDYLTIALEAVSGVIFLILTIAALRGYFRDRDADAE